MEALAIFIRKKNLKNPITKNKMSLVNGVFKKKILNENQLGFHMRYYLFLHYGWFLQTLGKEFTRTNMHTTVAIDIHIVSL